MNKNVEKILTRELVKELGLDKVSVITTDMLDGYTSIGDYAFKCCCSLTSVTIPDSVTSIGNYAFYDCISLTSVSIPNSVTSIGVGAFSHCSGLTSVTIPNSVTSIGDWAFAYCTGLTSVTIPDSVTSIGNYAFWNCTGLTSVTIPNSVTSIGYGIFSGCSSLTSIIVESGNTAYDSRNNCNAIIETTTNTLIAGCQSTIIPNSVTSIGDCAFYNCTGLTSVTIPNSVTSIGNYAFYDCKSLTSVTIGDKTYENQTVTNGKCKAYKAFNADMTCRDFQYEEGKTYEFDGEIILCHCGFHACLSLADVFNYYHGKLGKDIVVHEVELEGISDKKREDSKVAAKKITIGKRIL